VPAIEVKDDLARIVLRREELETLLAGTKEEPVLLHPNMGAEYRKQVANLAQVLNREENRGEAADILRSLVDRIELRPNQQGKLEIDLYGDLAGILTLAGKKDRPLDQNGLSVHQDLNLRPPRPERGNFSPQLDLLSPAYKLHRRPQLAQQGGGASPSKSRRNARYFSPFQILRNVSWVASPSVKAS
jgi:hypothetical protein